MLAQFGHQQAKLIWHSIGAHLHVTELVWVLAIRRTGRDSKLDEARGGRRQVRGAPSCVGGALSGADLSSRQNNAWLAQRREPETVSKQICRMTNETETQTRKTTTGKTQTARRKRMT